MLKINDLRVNYGGIEAVKGISFEVPEKSIVTLIGANGAGKRILSNLVCRQMRHMAFHMPKDMPECAEAGISTFVSVKRD